MHLEKSHPHPHSHLFTVRVWREEISVDQIEWRGKVQFLTSGDVRYFRDWTDLAPLILHMLAEVPVQIESGQERNEQ